MTRYRIVKNYKKSGWVIRLKQQDVKDLNIKDGDYIDIEDAIIIKKIPKHV